MEVKGFEVDNSKRSSQIQVSNNLFNPLQVQSGPLQKPVLLTKEVGKDWNLPSSELVIENQLAIGNNVGQLNRDVVTVNVNSKTERAVPNFEETLKGIDEELSEDYVISNLNTLKSGGRSGDKSDGVETSGEKQMAKWSLALI